MPKAIVIPARGNPYERQLGPDYATEMHHLVDGWLEHVPTNNNHSLFFNENGKYRPLPANPLATRLVAGVVAYDDYIAGDAVLLGKPDAAGESTDVTASLDDLIALLTDDEECP